VVTVASFGSDGIVAQLGQLHRLLLLDCGFASVRYNSTGHFVAKRALARQVAARRPAR